MRKTGLLLFDMLNVYYHGASEETRKRMKPVVNNAVRLLEAARNACSNCHEDSMTAFMDTVFPRMARVRTTDRLVEMIRKSWQSF